MIKLLSIEYSFLHPLSTGLLIFLKINVAGRYRASIGALPSSQTKCSFSVRNVGGIESIEAYSFNIWVDSTGPISLKHVRHIIGEGGKLIAGHIALGKRPQSDNMGLKHASQARAV